MAEKSIGRKEGINECEYQSNNESITSLIMLFSFCLNSFSISFIALLNIPEQQNN